MSDQPDEAGRRASDLQTSDQLNLQPVARSNEPRANQDEQPLSPLSPGSRRDSLTSVEEEDETTLVGEEENDADRRGAVASALRRLEDRHGRHADGHQQRRRRSGRRIRAQLWRTLWLFIIIVVSIRVALQDSRIFADCIDICPPEDQDSWAARQGQHQPTPASAQQTPCSDWRGHTARCSHSPARECDGWEVIRSWATGLNIYTNAIRSIRFIRDSFLPSSHQVFSQEIHHHCPACGGSQLVQEPLTDDPYGVTRKWDEVIRHDDDLGFLVESLEDSGKLSKSLKNTLLWGKYFYPPSVMQNQTDMYQVLNKFEIEAKTITEKIKHYRAILRVAANALKGYRHPNNDKEERKARAHDLQVQRELLLDIGREILERYRVAVGNFEIVLSRAESVGWREVERGWVESLLGEIGVVGSAGFLFGKLEENGKFFGLFRNQVLSGMDLLSKG